MDLEKQNDDDVSRRKFFSFSRASLLSICVISWIFYVALGVLLGVVSVKSAEDPDRICVNWFSNMHKFLPNFAVTTWVPLIPAVWSTWILTFGTPTVVDGRPALRMKRSVKPKVMGGFYLLALFATFGWTTVILWTYVLVAGIPKVCRSPWPAILFGIGIACSAFIIPIELLLFSSFVKVKKPEKDEKAPLNAPDATSASTSHS